MKERLSQPKRQPAAQCHTCRREHPEPDRDGILSPGQSQFEPFGRQFSQPPPPGLFETASQRSQVNQGDHNLVSHSTISPIIQQALQPLSVCLTPALKASLSITHHPPFPEVLVVGAGVVMVFDCPHDQFPGLKCHAFHSGLAALPLHSTRPFKSNCLTIETQMFHLGSPNHLTSRQLARNFFRHLDG